MDCNGEKRRNESRKNKRNNRKISKGLEESEEYLAKRLKEKKR